MESVGGSNNNNSEFVTVSNFLRNLALSYA